MAMGKRKRQRQRSLWVSAEELARGPGHPFYRRLNQLLDKHEFDEFVEAQCARFYADAKITKMKDGRTHLAHKVEHAVDMDSSAVVAVTIHGGCEADSHSFKDTLEETVEVLGDVMSDAEAAEAVSTSPLAELVADKGYHNNDVVTACREQGIRSYISEPNRGRRNWKNKAEAREATYANRRRIRGERGKALLRQRREKIERGFAHCFDSGGMRRLHLRGHSKVSRPPGCRRASRNRHKERSCKMSRRRTTDRDEAPKLTTRRQCNKSAGIAGAGIGVAMLGGTQVAHATDDVSHVFPGDDGSRPDDIQAAVTAGETVYVHGIWDLDALGIERIEIGREGNDVEIIGVSDGEEMAEIVGGSWTFLAVGPVKWSVRNLKIAGAHGTAIGMKTSSDLTVEGCRISGMVPQPVSGHFPWSIPVCIAPASDAPSEPPRLFFGEGGYVGSPEEVSGNIEIRDNEIDAYVPWPSYSNMGILIARSSADCKLVRNTIYNAWFSSVMVIESPGTNEIAGNTMNPAGGVFGVGIWLVAWAGFPLGNTSVSRNTITSDAGCFMGLGYGNFVEWDDESCPDAEHPLVVFSANDVQTNGCDLGTAVLHGIVKNSVWAQNKFTGAAPFAFFVWNDEQGRAGKGNVFQANNVARLQLAPWGAHLFLDTGSRENTVVGFSGSVITLGSDNVITGGDVDERPMNDELGQAISDARARVNAF